VSGFSGAVTEYSNEAPAAYIAFKCVRVQAGTRSHRKTPERQTSRGTMNLHLTIGPLLSLIAGILIFIVPRLLNYIVAIYLIVMGLIGLFGTGAFR
jgi:hypothetical protein